MKIDLSEELTVMPYRQGFKLLRPECVPPLSPCLVKPLAKFMSLPINFYLIDQESYIKKINPMTILTCGYISEKDAINRSVRDITSKEFAATILANDKHVIDTEQMEITEEQLIRPDESLLFALSFKYPWYDQDNKVAGILGCSIVFGESSPCELSAALTILMNLGLLNQKFIESKIREIDNICFLTSEEREILRLTIRGCNAKEIAKVFGLSHRTIEHKLERIKVKAKVKSKAELIALYFEQIDLL